MQHFQRSYLYLVLAGLFYLAVSWAYFPRIASISDEYEFLAQARVFSHGSLSMEGAGLKFLPGMVEVAGKHYGWRNPGLPIIQGLLLSIGGQDLCQVYSILVHLAVFVLTAVILRKLNTSPFWALLILAHPTLVIYSRTMLADETGALAILSAIYFLIAGPRPFAAGVCFGLACLFRMQCIVMLPFFCGALLLQHDAARFSRQAWILSSRFAAGCVPGLVLLFGYYGVIFGSYTGKSDQYAFSAKYLLGNLQHYGFALALWWPLMVLTPFMAKARTEKALRLIYLPFLLMLLFYFWFDQRPNPLITTVIGQRLLIPVIPVLVIAYALTAGRLSQSMKARFSAFTFNFDSWPVKCGAVLISCILIFALSRQHGSYQAGLEQARFDVESVLPENAVVICSPSFRELFWQRMTFGSAREFRHWYYGDTGKIASMEAGGRPLYIGTFSKGKDTSQDDMILGLYKDAAELESVAVANPQLRLYRVK